MKRYIATTKLEDAKKILKKVKAKADKYGIAFDYVIGDTIEIIPVSVYKIDGLTQIKVGTARIEAVCLEMTEDALIKNGEWNIIAQIEKQNDFNFILPFAPDLEIDPTWRTMPLYCDHCGTNRARKNTFLVQNTDGTIKQVGKQCLRDYTGISPEMAILHKLVHDIYLEDKIPSESLGLYNISYEVKRVLAATCKDIAQHGYRSAQAEKSTKEAVKAILGSYQKIEEKYMEQADTILRHYNAISDEKMIKFSEFKYETLYLLRQKYIDYRKLGILCYAPVMYEKDMTTQETIKAREESTKWIGTIGEKVEFEVKDFYIEKTLYFSRSPYSPSIETYIYAIFDEEGNKFIWKTQKDIETMKKIKGTIKDHTKYGGIKETVITRCKFE